METAQSLMVYKKGELQEKYEALYNEEAKTALTKEDLVQAILEKQNQPKVDPINSMTDDEKIVFSNPDKTPYELLALGLSQEHFEKLLSESATPGNGGEQSQPAEKPTLLEPPPEVKEFNGAYIQDGEKPTQQQQPLISDIKKQIQNEGFSETVRPQLIGKVMNLPQTQSVAQTLTSGGGTGVIDLSAYTKNGRVKMQKANGQIEVFSIETARRLVKIDREKYKPVL